MLPRLKSIEGPMGRNRLSFIEGVQYPGETIFIPSGWWHGALNLDLTVAITQNFCNEGNFEKVWAHIRHHHKMLSVHWLEKLRETNPTVHAKAIELNKKINFVMWDQREGNKDKFKNFGTVSYSTDESGSDS